MNMTLAAFTEEAMEAFRANAEAFIIMYAHLEDVSRDIRKIEDEGEPEPPAYIDSYEELVEWRNIVQGYRNRLNDAYLRRENIIDEARKHYHGILFGIPVDLWFLHDGWQFQSIIGMGRSLEITDPQGNWISFA